MKSTFTRGFDHTSFSPGTLAMWDDGIAKHDFEWCIVVRPATEFEANSDYYQYWVFGARAGFFRSRAIDLWVAV